jgi:hypothetical protein
MFETVEMRWFFDQRPLDIACHFQRHTEVQERTDWYSMPCNPLCGIKVREGKLEAKLRSTAFGLRSIAHVAGQLEGWRKWSLEFPMGDHPAESDLQAAAWLAVDKRRLLRRFNATGTTVTPTATRPVNGCEFEMTELVVDGRTFWTVGFEAVGPPAEIELNLQRVAHHVVAQGGFEQPFAETNSYGYAQWLAQFPPRT